jgi:crossover junction endodeoxyribonuclease RuvC
MKILGIDPGYERLGIAILEKTENKKKEILLFSECFKTSAQLEFADRLYLIGQEVGRVIKKYKPEILAIETLFLTTNQKTAMRVAEVRGTVIYEAKKGELKIIEITPLQVKIATTGYGKANKEQVMKMVKALVEVSENKKSDDELDAIAITLTGLAHFKS